MKKTSFSNRRSRLALLCLVVLAIPGGVASAQAAGSQRERQVDALFAENNRGATPGAAIAVVRDGRILLSRGYGLASLEHRVPITSATVFDVASVSKQFTGLAIAMLIEQGRIKLTDDIRTYIPELGDVGHKITIDHLVHHTSGLRDWPGTLSLAGWRMDDVISFDQILRLAYNQRTLNSIPGAEYTYSNTGYNLLAEVVARVTGQSFRVWTDANLFRPLGMIDSHFRDDHTLVIPNRAFGYARTPAGGYLSVSNNLTAMGSSSLFSTVDDLAKWVMNFDDPKLGGRTAMALTRTRGKLNDGSSIPYAFGISQGEYRGKPTVSHSGSWAAFATFIVHFPEQRFGVIVLANTGGINVSRAAYDIADTFLGTELGPRANPEPQRGVSGLVVTPAVLDQYIGLYRLGPGWYVRIRRDGGMLVTQATREAEFAMIPRSDISFWVEGYNSLMEFDRDGAVVNLTYRGRRYPRLVETTPLSPAQLAEFTGEYESEELKTLYRIESKDGGLVMRHQRHPTIVLTRLWRDDFSGASRFTRSVEFERDTTGGVKGFAVLIDDRSRHVRFVKRR